MKNDPRKHTRLEVELPLTWTCSQEDLMSVPGIGKKTAEALLGALAYTEET